MNNEIRIQYAWMESSSSACLIVSSFVFQGATLLICLFRSASASANRQSRTALGSIPSSGRHRTDYFLHNVITKNCRAKWRMLYPYLHLQKHTQMQDEVQVPLHVLYQDFYLLMMLAETACHFNVLRDNCLKVCASAVFWAIISKNCLINDQK